MQRRKRRKRRAPSRLSARALDRYLFMVHGRLRCLWPGLQHWPLLTVGRVTWSEARGRKPLRESQLTQVTPRHMRVSCVGSGLEPRNTLNTRNRTGAGGIREGNANLHSSSLIDCCGVAPMYGLNAGGEYKLIATRRHEKLQPPSPKRQRSSKLQKGSKTAGKGG